MVSECYLGESRLLYSSWGNKFQQGLKKKKDPHGPAKWHSRCGREPDHMSLRTLIPSSVSRKTFSICPAHIPVTGNGTFCGSSALTHKYPTFTTSVLRGREMYVWKQEKKSYPSVPRMSWKPSDGGLKWAYWINIFAVMRFLSTALCPHLGDHFPAGWQHRAKHWRHFRRN